MAGKEGIPVAILEAIIQEETLVAVVILAVVLDRIKIPIYQQKGNVQCGIPFFFFCPYSTLPILRPTTVLPASTAPKYQSQMQIYLLRTANIQQSLSLVASYAEQSPLRRKETIKPPFLLPEYN